MKKLTFQILKALEGIHRLGIVHADLKPENIGVKHQCKLSVRILDFGSAHFIGSDAFEYIQSRFYRAPEVILGGKYGPPIDIWSLGCVLVEVVTGAVLFPGSNENEMLELFTWRLGAPPEQFVSRCRRKNKFFYNNDLIVMKGIPKPSLKTILNEKDPDFTDLVQEMLQWDDENRISAEDALNHKWFNNA